MRSRLVLTTIALALGILVTPLAADAQQANKVHRLGVLYANPRPVPEHPAIQAFLQAMRERGYVEGQNLILERRFAEGKPERYPALAAELVRLNVDVILASGPALLAVKQATATIPVVMIAGDAVRLGFAQSLARPGGNFTGFRTRSWPASGLRS